MKTLFKPGDLKAHSMVVKIEDVAEFNGTEVHPVCATFTLAREIEYASRLFVIDMLEYDEEGVGTFLEIEHISPALVGDRLELKAFWEMQTGDVVFCGVEVKCGTRIVSKAKTQQKIVSKERFIKNLSRLAGDGEG